MVSHRMIYLLDVFMIVGSLIVLAVFIGYASPKAIAPLNGEETGNTSVLFSFENAEIIYIDDNLEFTSPMEIFVKDNIVVNLKPGKYYWKIKGLIESEIRELTILSEVDLRLNKAGEKYEVVNAGNVELDVDIYDKGTLVGKVVLDVDKNLNVKGDKFIGGQHE